MIEFFADYRPKNAVDAQFSVPFLIAAALLTERPSSAWSAAELRGDSVVLGVMDRVRLSVDPEFERRYWKDWSQPARVRLRLRDGRVLEETSEHPLGSPQNPLDEHALREKFIRNMRDGLAHPQPEVLWDAIASAPLDSRVSEITGML